MNKREIVSVIMILGAVLHALVLDCSALIRERKAKKKQAQDDTIPLVDMDLEKSMPPALEEGQKWPKYPQPAVVDQRPDALSCGPWVPVYLGGCRLQGYEGRVVRH